MLTGKLSAKWQSRSKLSSLWNVVKCCEHGMRCASRRRYQWTSYSPARLRPFSRKLCQRAGDLLTLADSSGPSAISQKRATTSDQNAANISCGSTQHICLEYFFWNDGLSLKCKESMNDLKAKASRACHVSCFWLDDLRINVLTDAVDTLNVRHARAGSEKDEARSQSGAGSLWILWTV